MPTSWPASPATPTTSTRSASTLGSFSHFARDASYPYGVRRAELELRASSPTNYMRTYGATREDFGRIVRRAARQRAAQPARAVQEAADAGRVSGGAADRRPDPSVRLRDALRRRRGLPGDARASARATWACRMRWCAARSSGTTPIADDPVQMRGGWALDRDELYAQAGVDAGRHRFRPDLRRLSGDRDDAVRGSRLLREGRGPGLRARAHASRTTAASPTTPAAASSRSARPARPAASSA